ncbi:NAD(P)H-binding protein [Nonomuraea phyllanthi]|uniref:NAD(P)H-binding protein n=1 Tax=Nonomuraea phyllanthi TaxID=2219224 RepID=A0A5C4WQU2_9ACTN|nr:NAD(P)H-binding protein [Nonomuraea phyllanthi]KAB8196043.1 NAD(P)H-binding protein [Nonomuraea phyllanthi]QFY07502.1 NAD(P)H-binding protein [Nonomuraea phyllanthi]
MILVTGAAGGPQGSTGRHVARMLLERGEAVRAFVHSDDHRADELRKLGADVVVGDLREIASVRPAMRGIRRAFFTYPVTAGLLDAAGTFAAAAREEGVERVVEVSQLDASPQAGTPRMRRHWVAEQVFDWAGVGAVHLRAAVFFENLAVATSGDTLALPLGPSDTKVPLVAGADVARVAAGLLLDPGPAEPVCLVTGQMATIGEAADALGVSYADLPPEEWEARAAAVYGDPYAVEHLTHLWAIFRFIGSGDHPLYRVTESIERYGGRPPMTLREFDRR